MVIGHLRDGCQRIIEDNVPSRTTSQIFTQPWINRDVRRITRKNDAGSDKIQGSQKNKPKTPAGRHMASTQMAR